MKNNIISIDLDDFNDKENILKEKQVPTPCTLTDAVEKFDIIIDCLGVPLNTKEDVELFKEEYLNEEVYKTNIVKIDLNQLNMDNFSKKQIEELKAIAK